MQSVHLTQQRHIHQRPLLVLLQSMSFDSWVVGISLVAVGSLLQNVLILMVGICTPAATILFRSFVERWLRENKLIRSAHVVAFSYLLFLAVIALLIGDPAITPLIIVTSLLPIVLTVLYDLPRGYLFLIIAVMLYILLIASLTLPLPTHIHLNDLMHLALVCDVLILGISRIITTYWVIQFEFKEQVQESQRRLEILQSLDADLELRNAQLEQAAKASDEANLAKTQFLHHMSHELRSPLNTVIGLSDIIAQDFEAFPPEMVKQQARQIYKAGQHLLSVISDVLDIAKIESGTLQVYYEPMDPLIVIRDLDAIISGLQSRWPDIHFTMDIPDKLPMLFAEDRRIRQILINLLDNAFKYTRQGEILLRTAIDPEGIIFTVQDNGIGIAKENYQRIFEPFEQVAGQQAIGTGLGLTITRHLILEHGGSISVDSQPGTGSTFTVFLPKAEIEFPSKGSGTVLLINSDRNINRVIGYFLTQAGYTPIFTSAPDEAREALHDQPIIAIILDVYLPTSDIGWQFIEELKRTLTIPVILYSLTRHWQRGVQLGALYLERPARPTAIIEALNKALTPTPNPVEVESH